MIKCVHITVANSVTAFRLLNPLRRRDCIIIPCNERQSTTVAATNLIDTKIGWEMKCIHRSYLIYLSCQTVSDLPLFRVARCRFSSADRRGCCLGRRHCEWRSATAHDPSTLRLRTRCNQSHPLPGNKKNHYC